MPDFLLRTAEPVPATGTYLIPAAPDTRDQRVTGVMFEGCAAAGLITAVDAAQRGFLLALAQGDTPVVRYRFDEPGPGVDAAAFRPGSSRFDRASEALAAQVAAAVPEGAAAVRAPALIQFVADRFTYGTRERSLGDDGEAMPPLDACDLTIGNCVDMHTTAVAALRAIGVPAVYVIGCFVYADKDEYPTGHCWLNVDAPGVPHHYDISHHVEYGLGRVTPALNPKPGRRFALGIGRGLRFEWPEGTVELPSLSGFHALSGDRRGQKLRTIGRFA
jgi:transglutaminase-like putative cysteine protease